MFLQDRNPSSGKLLDIGYGAGLFTSNDEKLGYDVTGIDFDLNAVNIARKKYSLKKVYAFSLNEFVSRFTGKFDIISLFEVLEHLDNPIGVFQLIKKILKIGGYIAVSIPNKEREIDTYTKMELPPNHLTHWNEKSIRHLLSLFNFKIVKLEKTVKIEGLSIYVSLETSVGLVKKKIGQNEDQTLSNSTVTILRLLSKYKTKIIHFLGNILYPPFKLINKQSSTISIS